MRRGPDQVSRDPHGEGRYYPRNGQLSKIDTPPLLNPAHEITQSCAMGSLSLGFRVGWSSQIPWPLPEGITGEALEKVLNKAPQNPKSISVTLPTQEDLATAHHELTQNKHLTLKLLYDEWNEANRIHQSYSRFCHYYRQYKKSLRRSFSNTYIGGVYSFIDFSGDSIGLTPKGGGDKIKTELFVWCFGASNMTYWEFVESQKQEELHKGMEHGMEYFQCVSKVCVVDNMKTAVTRACRYDPKINVLFSEFAEHHGFCVHAARPYSPKDKAKVEAAVLLAQRYLLASLRHTNFYSIESLNQKAHAMLEAFYNKV